MPASILEDIIRYKHEFVAHVKRNTPLQDIKHRLNDLPTKTVTSFKNSITRTAGTTNVRVIAEVKKASPSKGIIREDFNPVSIATSYAENNAAAISVLTDEEYFQGHLSYLEQIHTALPDTPLLRKDFVINDYQIYEARLAGASAILLITSVLDKYQLVDYRELANELGMDALTEVHLESEADKAAEYGARIIGINNRDLHTFTVDLEQTERVIRLLGGKRDGFIFVSESGISTPEHVQTVAEFGVDAILVGESLMRKPNPGLAIKELLDSSNIDS